MAKLSKIDLLKCVDEGLRRGGWNILYLSNEGEHPGRYRIYREERAFTVRVYIWNVTHGGGQRSAAEYRVQITGLGANHFDPEIGGETLILGWSSNEEVFAGFDYRRHSDPLGGSPSMQIGLPALLSAAAQRFAPHRKQNGEVAIAFRPDFIGTYVENLEALRQRGKVVAEAAFLSGLVRSTNEARRSAPGFVTGQAKKGGTLAPPLSRLSISTFSTAADRRWLQLRLRNRLSRGPAGCSWS